MSDRRLPGEYRLLFVAILSSGIVARPSSHASVSKRPFSEFSPGTPPECANSGNLRLSACHDHLPDPASQLRLWAASFLQALMSPKPGIQAPAMAPPVKYATEEEKREARIASKKRYYQR